MRIETLQATILSWIEICEPQKLIIRIGLVRIRVHTDITTSGEIINDSHVIHIFIQMIIIITFMNSSMSHWNHLY